MEKPQLRSYIIDEIQRLQKQKEPLKKAAVNPEMPLGAKRVAEDGLLIANAEIQALGRVLDQLDK